MKEHSLKTWWWQTAGLFLLFFIGFEIFQHHKPGESSFLPPCLFHQLTGLYCTGCGITRAFYALSHGNLKQALEMNALAVLALPIAIIIWFQKGWKSLKTNQFINIIKDARLIALLVILFTIMRNIPIYPFSWLAPG